MGARSSLLRRYIRRSLGTRAALMRFRHAMAKLKRIAIAEVAIVIGVMVLGLAMGGIDITGVMLVWLAMVLVAAALAIWPRFQMPTQATLAQGDLRTLVGRTELWLEAQCQFLPRPAGKLVDRIGDQLDMLGTQLDGFDERSPGTGDIRRLIGEHLPSIISSYTRIPANLRAQRNAGRTPDEQLVQSLDRISVEIGDMTRDLASGALDNLAVRSRYLDYKYGAPDEPAPGGTA